MGLSRDPQVLAYYFLNFEVKVKRMDSETTAYGGDGGEWIPASQSAFEMVRALKTIKKVFLTENGALPTKAYREDE